MVCKRKRDIWSFDKMLVALRRAVCVKYRLRGAEYLLGLLGLLGQKHSLDVGQYTTLGDGHTGE